jgi:CHASE1-domain containing sensor protein
MPSGMAEILFYACIPLAIAAVLVLAAWAPQYARRRATATGSPRMVLYPGPLLLAWLCLLLGLVATVHFADGQHQTAYAEANKHFLHETEQLEAHVQSQISELDVVLNGVRGLFLSSEDVSRSEFRHFVEARDLHLQYPGFRGLGFVQRLARPEVPAFVSRMRQAYGPQYQLHTEGERADLFVIKFLEPLARNPQALGYDIGSEAVRRQAAEAAMRSGQATLSARLSLGQDPLQRPGFLFLLPLYANATPPATEGERQRALRGWVFAPLVFSELMAGGSGVDEPGLDYQLFDAPELQAGASKSW